MWTNQAGWAPATREEVIAAGQPGVIDFAPYSVLREDSSAGSDKLTIASLSEMGATGDFFVAGDGVVLDPGGPQQETAVLLSVNPLVLTAPLARVHKVGEMIAWIDRAAPGVEVSGKVTLPDGRGQRSAQVILSNAAGVRRSATTSSFGFYTFTDVEAGQTYSIAVRSRRYKFASRSVSVRNTLTGVDFVATE